MTTRTKWLGQFPFGPYSPECVERPFAEACLNRGKLEIEAQSRCRNWRRPTRGRSRQQYPASASPAYLSKEVGRNPSTGVVRIGGTTKPGLNANSLRRICGLSILVHERDA